MFIKSVKSKKLLSPQNMIFLNGYIFLLSSVTWGSYPKGILRIDLLLTQNETKVAVRHCK